MAGRGCKKIISPEDMERAEAYAYNGCQNGTIEGLMGWNTGFIHDSKDIRGKLLQKRQERYAYLRKRQFEQGEKNPVMNIFLGKNYLGQADKQEITGRDGAPLAPPSIIIQAKE